MTLAEMSNSGETFETLGHLAIFKIFDPEFFLSKGTIFAGTKKKKNGTETEGKAIQRLPQLGIRLMCRHQILLMLCCVCRQEPGIAVP